MEIALKEQKMPILKNCATLHDLEKFMLSTIPENEQADMPLVHRFADGTYTREIFMPAGLLVIGKRHRHKTINIALSGSFSMYIDEKGGPVWENGPPEVVRIKAPYVFTSSPFSKKFLYIHEDTVFLTVHPTSETDLEKIEEEFIIKEQDYLDRLNKEQNTLMEVLP